MSENIIISGSTGSDRSIPCRSSASTENGVRNAIPISDSSNRLTININANSTAGTAMMM